MTRKTSKVYYEIQVGDTAEFIRCKTAEELPKSNQGQRGWLHYELADGTIGLKRPGTWRKVQK